MGRKSNANYLIEFLVQSNKNYLNQCAQPDIGRLVAVDLSVDWQQFSIQALNVTHICATEDKIFFVS